MFATGVLDINNVSFVNTPQGVIETIGFDSDYGPKVGEIYGRLLLIVSSPTAEISRYLSLLQDEVRQYDALAQSILQNVGDITFGKPIVYRATEKDLKIPESVGYDFDVYWLDLRATFREMDADQIDEMVINYAMPEGTVALELIPLQYSQEIAVSSDLGTPEVGIEVGDTSLTVGEFFRKTVAYKYLKPTVVAYGLGETRFSWALRDEAVRAGSHKFVAIVGVPKGSAGVDMGMSGHVRLNKGVLGNLLGGGGIAGTEAQVVSVSF